MITRQSFCGKTTAIGNILANDLFSIWNIKLTGFDPVMGGGLRLARLPSEVARLTKKSMGGRVNDYFSLSLPSKVIFKVKFRYNMEHRLLVVV